MPSEAWFATRCALTGGSGCSRHGAPRLPARCSGPVRGPAPARPALGRGGPSLRPRSRCALPKRSLGVAFRPRSAHAADDPRTAPFGGSQRSPPFRRVARRRLSLRASKRSLRVAFGSPPLTIPMGWQDMDSVARNHLAALSGGAANRSLRLAPAGRWPARYGSLPSVGPMTGCLVCMQS